MRREVEGGAERPSVRVIAEITVAPIMSRDPMNSSIDPLTKSDQISVPYRPSISAMRTEIP